MKVLTKDEHIGFAEALGMFTGCTLVQRYGFYRWEPKEAVTLVKEFVQNPEPNLVSNSL